MSMEKVNLPTLITSLSSPPSESEEDSAFTPTTMVGYMESVSRPRTEVVVCDPKTYEGQKEGAILSIKRHLLINIPGRYEKRHPESRVHDLVTITRMDKYECEVRNLRTGIVETIRWSAFFPLRAGQKCCCGTLEAENCMCEREASISTIIHRNESLITRPLAPPPQIPVRNQAGSAVELNTPEVADPATLAGQTTGAILKIKSKIHGTSDASHLQIEVDDHMELISGDQTRSWIVKARNLRTGAVGELRWEALFPVSERAVCECFRRWKCQCRCVYVDVEKSIVSTRAWQSKKSLECSRSDH